MRTAYGVETVRSAEAALMAELPAGALMQRAAAGLAAAAAGLLGRVYGRRVVLLVGSGDNGGDALYAGARLARRGARVTAVLLSPERAHGGGLAALRAAGGRVVHTEEGTAAARHGAAGSAGGAGSGADPGGVGGAGTPLLRRALDRVDLVLDGIVGIGGSGGLRPSAAALLRPVRDTGAPVLAVDLPSGIEADTGEVRGEAVTAAATVTFGTYKPGLLVDPAAERAGALRLVDIGLAPYLPAVPELEALQHADVAALLPAPGADSDKYRRGVVGVVAGSERYPGAAVLAVGGALRGGAGAVRYVGPAARAVIARYPETLVHPGPPGRAGRVQAWVVGPGLGDAPGAAEVLGQVLDTDVPVLVDADGLRLLDRVRVRRRSAPTLLTPHAGEAAALLGVDRAEVESGRLAAVRSLAAAYGATTLLKGSTTLVAEPDDGRAAPVRVNPTGTPWLATAGSGDVLSGLIGSLLAAGLAARDAASAGAYLHGLAARTLAAGAPATAHELPDALPGVWRDIRGAVTGGGDRRRGG